MVKKNGRLPIRSLEVPPGAEYDEETFLHLVDIERARAARASQQLRLLLVTLEPAAGKPAPIPSSSAARLFDGLRQLLRETDIVGWYRQSLVAGAVLTAPAGAPGYETSGLIEQRVGEGLKRHLPPRVSQNVRVKVTRQGPRRIERQAGAAARD